MSKKKIVIILAIFSMSIFLGYFIFENKEEKILSDKALFLSNLDNESEKNTESSKNNKIEDKISTEIENNNKLGKSENSIANDIDKNIIIKKIQEYILEGDYENGFKVLKGLIVESTNSEEEAEKTYAILKNTLNFGTSIILENIDELEGVLEELLGESIDANGKVVNLEDKVDLFIDKAKEFIKDIDIDIVLDVLKEINLGDLTSEVIDIISKADISK